VSILIVVENPDRWPLEIPGVEVVAAKAYLTEPAYSDLRGAVVFNLCRSYAYQRLGYYVSLLAEARLHKPKPGVNAMQDLRSRSIVRIVSDDLSHLSEEGLRQVQSDEFVLSIYFGQSIAKRHRRLALASVDQCEAPLMRARFVRVKKDWQIQSIGPIAASDIVDSHRPVVIEAAKHYFEGRRWSPRRRKKPRYWMAILYGTEGMEPASDERAVKKFQQAADSLGIDTELVTKDDYGRLGEFDALFIRETTNVVHHTFRFASRAAAEGLVVIDDPVSIARCNNKVFLGEHLLRHGVRAPRHMIVHPGNRDQVEAELGLPCVLKQPDSSFSHGVVKAHDAAQLERELDRLLQGSELILAQQWLPTDFDWRVGVLDRKPLYVCRYYMARRHWQILKHEEGKKSVSGKVDTLAIEDAPPKVIRAALKSAAPIGDGLYGIDVKELDGKPYVIEVNDNPTLDSGVEDRIIGKELYLSVMRHFLERLDQRRNGKS
jgi:glutathione synthase/RimK-type ligase-like ATP-grasp enzyme